MAVEIKEVVVEAALSERPDAAGVTAGAAPDVELIVRLAAERVLELLRREWDL